MAEVVVLSPETAYATKDNIVYPGDAAAAKAAEKRARARMLGVAGAVQGVPAMYVGVQGSNKDFVLRALTPGADGNDITITVATAGASTALSVSVTGTAITVANETNSSSAAVSTALEIVTAINADADASALVIATLKNDQTGAGVTGALSATELGGGLDQDDVTDNFVGTAVTITPGA